MSGNPTKIQTRRNSYHENVTKKGNCFVDKQFPFFSICHYTGDYRRDIMKNIKKLPNFKMEKFEIVKAQDGDVLISFLNRVAFPDVVKFKINGSSIIFPRGALPDIELMNVLDEDLESITQAGNVYIAAVQDGEAPCLRLGELEA
jgi:hypothetical protein